MVFPPNTRPADLADLPKGEIEVWLLEGNRRSPRSLEEIDANYYGMVWARVRVFRLARDRGGIEIAFGGCYGWYHPDNVRIAA
jgi:predicted transcriptional regulator